MDVMLNYRQKRKRKKQGALENVRKSGNDCDISTPVSSINKRGTSSPAETRPEKGPKGKPTNTAQLKEAADEGWKPVKSKKTARKKKNEGRKTVKENHSPN